MSVCRELFRTRKRKQSVSHACDSPIRRGRHSILRVEPLESRLLLAITHSGSIDADETWTTADVHQVTGDVSVAEGVTLTIDPGAMVQFNAWSYDLIVHGTLVADGRADAMILFTSVQDDTGLDGILGTADDVDTNGDGDASSPYRGSWSGVQLAPTSTGSVMDYVDVRYGGRSYAASVFVNGGELTLTNSKLQESSAGGLRIESGHPMLTDNVYRNNSGSAITMDLGSNPAIVGVTVENNGVNGLSLDYGTLTGDGFWDDPDIVYRLTGDTTVPAGSTLTVGAGQVVKVENWSYDLIVAGTLIADGTAAAPIVFTSERDDTGLDGILGTDDDVDTNNNGDADSPYPGSWSGIQLEATSTASVMDHVDVRYGGRSYPASVYVNGGELTLTNSMLQESSTSGLRIESSNPTLTNNVYRNNSDSAVTMDLASNPAIVGVTIENNGVNGLSLDPGPLAGDGSWDDPDIVYLLTGDTSVPAGNTLTVGAGQVVKTEEWSYDLIVGGTLIADGTAAAPIVFTSERDDTGLDGILGTADDVDTNNNGDGDSPYAGSWSGIQLEATSTGSVMDYVDVRYGGRSYAASVLVDGGELTLTNSKLQESSTGGLRIQSSNPTLTDNVYRNNTGSAVAMDLASNPAIAGVTIENNGVNGLSLDPGTLVGDGSWDDPDIVYLLTGDTSVPAGNTLTVGAGQVVKVEEWSYDLSVDGTLIADGTAVAPIVFTSERDDTAGNDTNNNGDANGPYPGSWSGIQLTASSTASVMDYVDVRYGGRGYPASVYANGGELALTNGVIRDSRTNGLQANGDIQLELANCSIVNNVYAGVRVESGAVLDARNNTIDRNERGISVSSAFADVINNTIAFNGTGIRVDANGIIRAANNIVASQTLVGLSVHETGSLELYYNDIYNPDASGGNFEGIDDPMGSMGNIARDPLFYGRGRTGDYRLWQGSPAIDAALSSDVGLGIAAPITDARGLPRFDDPGIEPNTGGGTPNYYDMGALERQEVSEPDADLAIQLDTWPADVTVGDAATLSWTVTNLGPNVAYAPWFDCIDFIQNPTGVPATRLVEVEHTNDLAVGESYQAQATFSLPGFGVDDYYWRVETDNRSQVFEALLEDNNVVESGLVAVDVTELTFGVPFVADFAADGDKHWYRFEAQAGQNIRLSLDRAGDDGRSELFVGQGFAPDVDNHIAGSGHFGGPDASLDQTNVDAGTYYVLAQGTDIPDGPISYQLLAEVFDFEVFDVTPDTVGNAGQVTVTVSGQAIPLDADARLVGATGEEIAALSTHWFDSTRMVATFDLQGIPAGSADVTLHSGGRQETLDDAVQVVSGGEADFWLEITGPRLIRIDRPNTYVVTWGNRGSIDATVPLVFFETSNVASVSLEPNSENFSDGHLFLAMSPDATTPVIPPGAVHSQQIYVTTTEVGDFSLRARSTPITSPELVGEAVDWADIFTSARPPEYNDAQWNALFNQIRSQLGEDWSTFIQQVAAGSLEILHQPDSPIFSQSLAVGLRPALLDEIGEAAEALGWLPDDGAQPITIMEAIAAANGVDRPAQIRPLIVTAWKYEGKEQSLASTWWDMLNLRKWFRSNPEICEGNADFESDATSAPSATKVTKEGVEEAVETLVDESREGDTLYLHFATHGIKYDSSDTTYAKAGLKLPDGAYLYKDLLQTLSRSEADNIVVVVDACHSESLIQRVNVSNDLPPEFKDKLTVITSAGQEQQAQGRVKPPTFWDKVLPWRDSTPAGGRFTTEFLKALKKVAYEQGIVSPKLAFDKMMKDNKGNVGMEGQPKQTPHYFGPGSHVFLEDPTGETKEEIDEEMEEDGYTLFEKFTGSHLKDIEFRGQSGASRDPNEKQGLGFGEQGWITPDGLLAYTIYFENIPDPAVPPEFTLPAQEVIVTDQLSADLDWSTLELGDLGFGSTVVDIPDGMSGYEGSVLPETDPYPVYVYADLDALTGTVTWLLRSYDGATGLLPDDPTAGFLPVNDATHRGEGFVTFTIRHRDGLAHGDQFLNSASIVFDTNAPILTNTFTNTIDGLPPSSAVDALLAGLPSTGFDVSWTGNDAGGSGIASYDIYVSEDGGPYELWQDAVAETSAVYTGRPGHTYAFYSVAVDNVGHREAAPAAADAQTTVSMVADLGPVDYRFLGPLNLADDTYYYRMESVYNGLCTLQIDVPEPADSARLKLYDADPVATAGLTPLAESALDVDGNQRIDRAVNSGEVYYVEVYGAATDCDFRLANLLSQVGDVVTVHGSAGDDVIKFDAAASRTITINGIAYHREDSEVATVDFTGGDGFDVAWLYDSSGNETVEAWPDRAVVTNGSGDSIRDYVVNVSEIESLLAYATRGGNDTATFHGSAGADKLKSYEDSLRLRAKDNSFAIRAKRFDTVVCDSGFAGNDLAVFKGTDGNETLTYVGSENAARIEATNRDHSARGFGTVVARAEGGTGDMSYFTDTADDDVFYFKSHKTVLVSPQAKITVRAFDEVHATANESGFDVARIYDTEGDEHLEVSGDTARLYRRNGSELDLIYAAIGFERVKAYSTDGDDTKDIQDHTLELLLYGWDA
jgi:parallel beta helix pectate lyase-like protein/caspase domain-containing protein/pre-peptidase/CARDB protein